MYLGQEIRFKLRWGEAEDRQYLNWQNSTSVFPKKKKKKALAKLKLNFAR